MWLIDVDELVPTPSRCGAAPVVIEPDYHAPIEYCPRAWMHPLREFMLTREFVEGWIPGLTGQIPDYLGGPDAYLAGRRLRRPLTTSGYRE